MQEPPTDFNADQLAAVWFGGGSKPDAGRQSRQPHQYTYDGVGDQRLLTWGRAIGEIVVMDHYPRLLLAQ